MTDEFDNWENEGEEEEKTRSHGQIVLMGVGIFLITFTIGLLGGCTVGLLAILGLGGGRQ